MEVWFQGGLGRISTIGLQLLYQLADRGDCGWIKVFQVVRVDGHTDSPSLRMHHEGRLQQMVHLLAHIDIKPWVGELNRDIFQQDFGLEPLLDALITSLPRVGNLLQLPPDLH
eukprot:Skav219145  [mRNA]  locus=scaffold1574:745928:747734:- [translate_table: standard]